MTICFKKIWLGPFQIVNVSEYFSYENYFMMNFSRTYSPKNKNGLNRRYKAVMFVVKLNINTKSFV